MFRYAHKLEVQRMDGVLGQPSPLPHLYSMSYYQLSEELARTYPELTLAIFSGTILKQNKKLHQVKSIIYIEQKRVILIFQ